MGRGQDVCAPISLLSLIEEGEVVAQNGWLYVSLKRVLTVNFNQAHSENLCFDTEHSSVHSPQAGSTARHYTARHYTAHSQ